MPSSAITKNKKALLWAAVAILALGITLIVGARSYLNRFARWPVHRLPDLPIFESIRVLKTKADIMDARTAIQKFAEHYDRLPINSPEREYQFSTTLGHDLNAVNPSPERRNSDKIVFWDVPAGEQMDGWGREYHFFMDHDDDGWVRLGDRKVKADCVIWSDGPNQTDDFGLRDDIGVSFVVGSSRPR